MKFIFIKPEYICFLILFLKISICHAPLKVQKWMVWNVGQGQWITHVEFDSCTHYDFGGEAFHLKKIRPLYLQYCRNKLNKLNLSHADWDHYSFYHFIIKNNVKTCWNSKPKEVLRKINTEISFCNTLQNKNRTIYYDQSSKLRNDSSTVFQYEHILIPGDSPIKKEKIWIKNMIHPKKISILFLGHHGSKTSTSHQLLTQIPNLNMAIASSRLRKYGHPHKEVIQKLNHLKLSPIKTESWGSVLIL